MLYVQTNMHLIKHVKHLIMLFVKRFRLLELYISRYHLLPGRSVSGFLLDEGRLTQTDPKPEESREHVTTVS